MNTLLIPAVLLPELLLQLRVGLLLRRLAQLARDHIVVAAIRDVRRPGTGGPLIRCGGTPTGALWSLCRAPLFLSGNAAWRARSPWRLGTGEAALAARLTAALSTAGGATGSRSWRARRRRPDPLLLAQQQLIERAQPGLQLCVQDGGTFPPAQRDTLIGGQ